MRAKKTWNRFENVVTLQCRLKDTVSLVNGNRNHEGQVLKRSLPKSKAVRQALSVFWAPPPRPHYDPPVIRQAKKGGTRNAEYAARNNSGVLCYRAFLLWGHFLYAPSTPVLLPYERSE